MLARRRRRREASLSAAVIDSQEIKTSETAGTKGYNGNKKVKRPKRYFLVDADGRLLDFCVSPGDMHIPV